MKGVIAAGDPLTAQTGAEILKAGGNAFDAAIAATFMSFAASSSITSAGGGGYMLAHTSANRTFVFDFFVQTPIRKKPIDNIEFFPVTVDFGEKTQEFHIGLGSAATPGNIAGLFEIHQKLGSMPMKTIMEPVIENINKGITLHEQTKYQIDILRPIHRHSADGRKIYYPDNKDLGLGDTCFMPDMADFFGFISLNGPDEFYKGEIARKIAWACQTSGGHLTKDDFLNYRVEIRSPLNVSYRGYEVYTNPPPNSGGPLIAFMLKLLEQVKLSPDAWGSIKHLQALTDIMRATANVRAEYIQDNPMNKEITEMLLSPAFLKNLHNQIARNNNKSGNTTHVSVADKHYNIATITTSVGEGCGYFIPGTDIMLNNMLGEEDLNKNGFHAWEENIRMNSMMAPTLLKSKDGNLVGLGSGGSNRIRSAIVQAIINFIDFGMPPEATVNTPRIHWENNHLDIEPGFDEDVLSAISLPAENKKLFWKGQNMYFGGVHAVFIDEKSNLYGAGDLRRAGSVVVV